MKMKIGILTYHRSNNYGALLQGIALREVLARAGHDVTFIDYWPAYHRHMYALFSIPWMMSRKGFGGKKSYLKNCIQNYKYRKIRKTNFDVFIKKNIEPYISSINDNYDVIVHGSDQIWRKQPEIYSYNPVYFGKHQIKSKKKISYAASMGVLPNKKADREVVKNYLSNLDCISVRENDLREMVVDLGYPNVSLNLDPTLLLSQEYWVYNFELIKNSQQYAIYYKIQDSFDEAELRQYAKAKGFQLKVIHNQARCAESVEHITTASPLQFLQLIYGASMVFTSSFHGLAFSLIFHKPFYASFTKNEGRAKSLLHQCKLDDHLLVPKSAIPSTDSIDYSSVDFVLDKLRRESIADLKDTISF